MSTRPQTVTEWAQYIKGLSGQALFSQATAANSQSFARTLTQEGLTMQQVEKIMLLFVRQLRATGTKVPVGGTWDLLNMALTDPVARQGPTLSEEEAEFLAVTNESTSDELDDFELEAAFR